ncbi:hypothetical protein [Stratiformator vulcanicus]|uniref:Uncharacterized protein n=1 Tax=Stratiformator vulcanicus TaxID=2527980 RepID=A0A517R2F1_9PLAN|nr:hypothetical protein [Stratiformator vulcanicus]QDT38052.1 hypothetical protein Pan189_24370 [Stratiformator vulcanicus]
MTTRPFDRRFGRILLVGDIESSLCREVGQACLDVFGRSTIVLRRELSGAVSTLTTARSLTPDPAEFDLGIVALDRPLRHRRHDIDRLIGTAALSWVVVLGEWCESEMRAYPGHWPVALAVRGRESRERLLLERSAMTGDIAALPVMAGRDETFGAIEASAKLYATEDGEVCDSMPFLSTADRVFRRYLDDVLTGLPNAQPLAVIDADPLTEATVQTIWQRAEDGNRVLVLSSEPDLGSVKAEIGRDEVEVQSKFVSPSELHTAAMQLVK